ncbi:TetR family transcriptional regulator C-terminal domain-containing protein [Pelagibius sp. Alg239-R121]|uniref:TetR family transcriptional regulator C-terminal domain-containing protein n=1 Tax=Pelagibius sp. Alg239-R121 TaxID=2993448 RepID=UPI0024A656FA|nr:TetR family transcriptional regulator C-terminal domain-containing protein [Pelagibius sp. Alg239-R121]
MPQHIARPRTQPEIRVYRRQALLRAALEAVAQHDIAGATVDRICRLAGASRGLIGHYFSGKEELLVATLKAWFDEGLEKKREVIAAADLEPHEKLRRIVRLSFTPPTYRPAVIGAMQAFVNASRSMPAYREPLKRFSQSWQALTAPLFNEAAKLRGCRCDAEQAAVGLLMLLDGLWGSLAVGKDNMTVERAIKICDDYLESCLCDNRAPE